MDDKKCYSYTVKWSEEDNQWVGICDIFPSLSWVADTPEEALKGVIVLVCKVIGGDK